MNDKPTLSWVHVVEMPPSEHECNLPWRTVDGQEHIGPGSVVKCHVCKRLWRLARLSPFGHFHWERVTKDGKGYIVARGRFGRRLS